jgi:hypothetical protein
MLGTSTTLVAGSAAKGQLPRRAERCTGVTSPSHHLTAGGVRPQTRWFVHVAAGLVPGAADKR